VPIPPNSVQPGAAEDVQQQALDEDGLLPTGSVLRRVSA
jgi:hypothetical protein